MDSSSIRKQLFNNPELQVYAVIDGAALPELLAKLEEHEPEYSCLFRGELPFDLAEAAPYLVKLEEKSVFADWLMEKSSIIPCCIYAQSSRNFLATRKHFRSLLDAQLPDGEVVHFRYYDPRVLDIYLPLCEEDDEQAVYGECIKKYFITNIEKDKQVSYRPRLFAET